MKKVLLFNIILLLIPIQFVSNGFAQDYTQWRLPEGAITRLGKGTINDIKFSPDDTQLAVATSIGVWLYDAQTGTEIALLKERRVGHCWANTLAFSSDGIILASGIWRDRGPIQLWDTTTGEKYITLKGEIGSIRALTFSADGSQLYCVHTSRAAKLNTWEIATGQQVLNLSGMLYPLSGFEDPFVFSPNARYVAGGYGNIVKMWEVPENKMRHTFDKDVGINPRTSQSQTLAFSADGKTLASARKTIRLWNVETGTEVGFLPDQPRVIGAITFSPNGKTLVTGNYSGTIQLWNIKAQNPSFHTSISGHNTLPLKSFSFTTDSKTLASGSQDGTIRIWDLKTKNQQLLIQGHTENVKALQFLEDGKTLFSCGRDGTFRYYNIDTGAERLIPTEQKWFVFALALSKNEKMIASGNVDGLVRLWDTETNTMIATLKGHKHGSIFNLLQFSEDGKTLGSVSFRGEAIVWDVSTRKQLFYLPGDNSKYFSPSRLAFSPDLKILALGLRDKNVQLWETFSEKISTLKKDQSINKIITNQIVRALAFSPDGRTLVTGDWQWTIKLWNVETRQHIADFIDAKGTISALKFSPDGTTVAKGGESGAVELWDVATKTRIWYNHSAHADSVTHFAFTPDQKTLVSGSADGTILVWDLEKMGINKR